MIGGATATIDQLLNVSVFCLESSEHELGSKICRERDFRPENFHSLSSMDIVGGQILYA